MSGETDHGSNPREEEGAKKGEEIGKLTSEASSLATIDKKDGEANESATFSATDTNQGKKKISKNQLKRQRKWEKMLEHKKRKKERQKDVKIAKAKAEGRDIDTLKEDMERRRLDGSGWARRNEHWQQIFEKTSSKYQVYMDCSFEQSMTRSEINSLANQIRYCYAFNKKAKHPVKVTACSLGGETLDLLEKVSGFDQWEHRAFHQTEKDIVQATEDKSKLVYLTSDSDITLQTLEDDKIYIIGGIVDRNRLKRAAINRAEKFGIQTAKLPISDYLSMVSTKVLTCNHVFEILLKWRENEGD